MRRGPQALTGEISAGTKPKLRGLPEIKLSNFSHLWLVAVASYDGVRGWF
jgi:hypothetical protein